MRAQHEHMKVPVGYFPINCKKMKDQSVIPALHRFLITSTNME